MVYVSYHKSDILKYSLILPLPFPNFTVINGDRMKYICTELNGALLQPNEDYNVNGLWLISAPMGGPILQMDDFKLFIVTELKDKNGFYEKKKLFTFCYQFLFLKSEVYYSLSMPHSLQHFVLEEKDITEVSRTIKRRFVKDKILTPRLIDFNNIHKDKTNKFRYLSIQNTRPIFFNLIDLAAKK